MTHYITMMKYETLTCRTTIPSGNCVVNKERWDKIARSVVFRGLIAKFEDANLKNLLYSTRPSILLYETADDNVWGIGPEKGKNIHGNMLMYIRDNYIYPGTDWTLEFS
jgi:predicted NAD-dependent protein-ADP-ribosyltransferase YbiA (DUF1768 family)